MIKKKKKKKKKKCKPPKQNDMKGIKVKGGSVGDFGWSDEAF